MLFGLVLRNINRNKKNSAIIIILITVITFIFFTGNNLAGNSNLGIRKAFNESLTGDVVIKKQSYVTMSLFGANTPIINEFVSIPVFPAYDAVMDLIRADNRIAGITSQVTGYAYLDLPGIRDRVLLCGIDASTYFSIFPGIVLIDGRFLQNGEFGAMITEERANSIKERSGIYPEIGVPLLLTSGGNVGFKIREVPLVGIFQYQNPAHFMNEIILIDPQTVRVLNSINVAASSALESNNDILPFLAADLDSMFLMDFTGIEPDEAADEFSAAFLQEWFSQTGTDTDISAAGGDWNFIIIRLKEGVSTSGFIRSLNKKLHNFDVVAVNWRIAAGVPAILLQIIQILFNAGIFLVCIAGIIAAINIFLISVYRRTREIGTLRAIGASDFCIRSLVLQENLLLAAVAAFIGISAGGMFFRLINSLNLQIPNELLASMFGGSFLTLEALPGVTAASVLVSLILGFVASIYPMEVTVRVEPMEAIRKER